MGSFLLLLLFGSLARETTAAAAPANVLFYLIDDLGYGDVGYHARDVGGGIFTPTIDELAMKGIRLENYYVNFLCSPTRTSLMSGRYAYTIGMNAEVIVDGHDSCMPTSVSTIADRLKGGGWATSAYGKWDMGMTAWGCTPTCRGFDHFFGFYNAFNDYFTHEVGHYLDLRNGTVPVTNLNGSYFTEIVTEDAIRWIKHVRSEAPNRSSFAYLAHESNHGPLEVPHYYTTGLCESAIPSSHPARRIVCGMMRAVDASLKNLTQVYKDIGIWDQTVIIMSADNGGNTDTGGNNYPLRGNKASSWEGGVRAAGWVGGGAIKRSGISRQMIHVSDWYPTIVHGIGGLAVNISADGTPALDGLDVWAALMNNSTSPRNEMLLQLAPGISLTDASTKAAIRIDNWKLITGKPDGHAQKSPTYGGGSCANRDNQVSPSSIPYPISDATSPPFCPNGWVPPPENMSLVQPPPDVSCPSFPCSFENSSYEKGGIWLFDIDNDPHERHEVSKHNPDVVARLMKRLQEFVDMNISQQHPAPDPASNPANFGGVWTPWQGDPDPNQCANPNPPTPPSPPPSSSCGIGNLGRLQVSKTTCSVQGWCSAPNYKGPSRVADLFIDKKLVQSKLANVSRHVAGPHGFEFEFDCSLLKTGKHTVDVQCVCPPPAKKGTMQHLMHAPICTTPNPLRVVPCGKLFAAEER